METAKQKILKMQSTLEVWKMKAINVGELKKRVVGEELGRFVAGGTAHNEEQVG